MKKYFDEGPTIPKDMGPNLREVFEEKGVMFHKLVEIDENIIHWNITYPDGWTVNFQEQENWFRVLDEKGKVIADMFLKWYMFDESFIRLAL